MKIPNLRAKFKPKGCKGNIHFGKVVLALILAGVLTLNSFNTIGYAASKMVASSGPVRDIYDIRGATTEVSGNTIRAVGEYKRSWDDEWRSIKSDSVTRRSGYSYRAEWNLDYRPGGIVDIVSLRLIEYKEPSPPSSISVGSTSKAPNTTFNIIWGAGAFPDVWWETSGTLTYRLERQIDGGRWSQVYSGANRSYSDTTSSEWETVRYRVRSYDGDDYSSYRTSSIIYVNHAPTTPSNIDVPSTLEGGKDFTVFWGSSTDPDGDNVTYRLERKINNGSWTQVYSGTGKTFTDTAQSNWNTVTYRVRAFDGIAYSDYRTSPIRTVIHNTIPTLTIITPSENSYFV